MKKIILVLSLCTFLCLSCFTAFADDNGIDVSWNGDYEKMQFAICIKSNLPYTQQASVLVYDAGLTEYNFENFTRIFEITVKSGTEEKIIFPITDDFVSSNNKYVIKVQGSGYLSSNAKSNLDAWIIPPSDINSSNGVLAILNSADINTVETAIDAVDEALEIAVPANVDKGALLKAFLSSRANDYDGGKFRNLNDVRSSWNGASVIAYLTGNSVITDDLIVMSEQNYDSFNLDLENNDYVNNKEDIYKLIISYAKDNKDKVVGCKKLEGLFNEYQVVACFNNSKVEDIPGHLEKYYSVFGKDISYYNKYLAFTKEKKDIANRQLYNKNYKDLATLADNFVNAVTELYNGNDSGGGTGGGSGNGGGSTGGGGGKGSIGGSGSLSIPAGMGNVSTPVNKSDFIDCPPTHWAYTYIQKLRDKGVVSGYSTGEFYPERSVSREEFIKMFVSAVGLYNDKAECNFADVKNSDWHYKYVASANSFGIIYGINENDFGVGMPITREDVADILGHSSVNTTRIYTMETGETHRRQIQKLGLLRL